MHAGDTETQTTVESKLLSAQPGCIQVEMTPERPSDATQKTPRSAIWQRSVIWQRLRSRRREAAAVVTLIVMATIWFDSGSSRVGSDTTSIDPLEGYDAVLSDFDPVKEEAPQRDSADPFESTQNSAIGQLTIPQAPDVEAPDTSSASNMPAGYYGGPPAANASYPDDARGFAGAASGSGAMRSADSQNRRRVRFAGRIQPAH